MRVAALFSGGKDSIFAVRIAQMWGWEVTHLVTLEPENAESFMFHVPNLHLAPMLAEAMGIPHVRARTSGEPERELDDLRRALAPLDIQGVVSGAVASEYQRTRIERVTHALGIASFAPLWHKRGEALVSEMIAAGMRMRFSATAADGLDAPWLGRALDEAALADLVRLGKTRGIHPGGEGGEYESVVLDAPWFRKRLEVEEATAEWRRDAGVWRVTRARLAPKA